MYFIFAEGVVLALFVLLTDLESEESSQAFFEAAVAVRAASRRFMFAKGMMRMAYLTAVHTHIDLPPRAERLFQDFTEKSWKSEDINLFSSELPNIALMIRPDHVDTGKDEGKYDMVKYTNDHCVAELIGLSALFARWERVFPQIEGDPADTDSSSSSSNTASLSP
jgi:hypothetical protein